MTPADKIEHCNWNTIADDLSACSSAVVEGVLSPDECRDLAALYPDDSRFRSRVIMGRHGFGKGEYKYFSYPLPDVIAALRPALYARLAPIANHWNERMGIAARYPARHEQFLAPLP